MSDTAVYEDKPEPRVVVTKGSLVVKFASKYGVDSDKMLATLKATAFKTRQGDPEVTNEQMMALLIVADQYHLNPFTKEIFAFPDKKMGIIPVVSVDGWARIVNEHPQFDGLEFNNADEIISNVEHKDCPASIETVIYRKDRSRPTKTSEYLDEVYRAPFKSNSNDGYVQKGPWQTHTKRFLRHKSFIQCARLAFGFAGIYDEDEANRIQEANDNRVVSVQGATRAEQAKNALRPSSQEAKPEVPPSDNFGKANLRTDVELEKTAALRTAVDMLSKEILPSRTHDADSPSEPVSTQAKPPFDLAKLTADSIASVKAAKSIKDLRARWDKIIDAYMFEDLEIPPDVEDQFLEQKRALS